SKGHSFRVAQGFGPEEVAARWKKIGDFTDAEHPADINAAMAAALGNLSNPSLGGNEFIDLDQASKAQTTVSSSYDERDVALYALGVG
ncbi:hypothetical protein ACSTIB_23495, partial [Vibrio parahaemolyticus]